MQRLRCEERDEPARKERAADVSRENRADLSRVALAAGTPTRSVTQKEGAQERSAMRNRGLDLGAKQISFCEVADGKVCHDGP